MRMAFQCPSVPGDRWRKLEYDLGQALLKSAPAAGWEIELMDRIANIRDYDVIGMFGVRNMALIHACELIGKPYLYFDKAYNRKVGWWRMSWCCHNPSMYLADLDYPDDRRAAQKWKLAGWQENRKGHIVIAGSSAKFHNLYRLLEPTGYWMERIKRLRGLTDRRIIYRPKKSWHEAVPLRGTVMSTEDSIYEDLDGAWAMITTGSNSCFEAMEKGIPAIVLGDGISRLFSSTELTSINEPYLAPLEHRQRFFRNLAYFQYKVDEFATGAHWKTINDCIRLRKELQDSARDLS